MSSQNIYLTSFKKRKKQPQPEVMQSWFAWPPLGSCFPGSSAVPGSRGNAARKGLAAGRLDPARKAPAASPVLSRLCSRVPSVCGTGTRGNGQPTV